MSTTNANQNLSYGGVGLRRFPQPHSHSSATKPSPSLSQHASPYQTQPYAQQQQPTQAQYPHHLFSTPTPPQIPNVATVQNAARPQQSQVPPVLPGPRQRAPPPRQMQQQATPHPSYLQQSLNQQSMSQPMNPQQLSQQALSQPSLSQQQPLSQTPMTQHSMGQHLPQPMSQPSMAQSLSQQSLNQTVQNDSNSIISQQQPTSHAPSQPTLPPAQSQVSQVHQTQQVQKVQQVQQVQQQPTPPQPEPVEPAQDNNQDEDMEGSQDESGEGDSSMDPKVIDGAPFVPRSPMGPMMSAPPEGGSFPTLEAVHKYALAYCTSVGYAIVIGRSKKTVPGLKKVLFVCDRAGKPPRRVTPENRKRKTTSRKCDCQFGFFAIEQRTQWVVRYRPDPEHLRHNHGPSESPLLHPAARKLDSKMISTVKSLKESGMFK